MTTTSSAAVIDRLTEAYPDLTPQVQQAAQHVLDYPGDVAVLSMRQLAAQAGIKPNTLVRMARILGFDGYDDLREPFRHEVTRTGTSFPDKARWLQTIAEGKHHGDLLAELASSNLAVVEQVFADLDTAELKTVADKVLASVRTGVLGVGALQPLAEHFCYVGSMALTGLVALPTNGGLPIDDASRMGVDDVLISMTFAPYRVEIVEATRLAAERGATTALLADHTFVVATDTPQFFSSVVGVVALLEALLSFMVADSRSDATGAIAEFHEHRRAAGVYVQE